MEIAEKLNTSQAAVHRYETGRRPVSIDFLVTIAALLGRPVAYFIEQGDGLTDEERALIYWMRNNPDDAAVVIATFRSLKNRSGNAA